MLASASGPARHRPSSRFAAWLRAGAACALLLGLAACGGSGSNTDSGTVQLDGRVTYDFVPAVATEDAQGNFSARLDYSQTRIQPARGVQVEAVADDGAVLAATQADADGAYRLTVPASTSVRLRAKARLLQAAGSGASWDFAVRDNTSNAALWAVQGPAFGSGRANQVQNLHAGSGWNGSGYTTGARAAAPFAILDQVYSAKQKVLGVDPGAVFAPMIAYWSPANRPTGGDPALGYIGTSHWNPGGSHPGLYILGKEDVDTDEYDSAVIVHEWGHYFESRFSRADSIGGSHGSGDMLDMRVAFSEGWGNALAGMVRGDPLYVDTLGLQQAKTGVVFDVSTIEAGEPLGWFNEASVQSVLYQLYQSPTIGFSQIYDVMIGPQKNTEALTSLFSFATYLRNQASLAGRDAIDQYLAGINTVNGAPPALDIWGSKQTYPTSLTNGNEAAVLPVYVRLNTISPTTTVCRTDAFGSADNNKLGNTRYLRLDISQGGTYKLTVTSNTASNSLEVAVYRQGNVVQRQTVSAQQSVPTILPALNLAAGDYVVTITDTSALQACFNLALSQ